MTLKDEYGFSCALKTALVVHENASRRSGRTARMIDRVKPGDQIIVTDERYRQFIQGRLRQAGKTGVSVIVCAVDVNPFLVVGTPARGETIFDHEWVRQYFEWSTDQAIEYLGVVMRETTKSFSGHDIRTNGT